MQDGSRSERRSSTALRRLDADFWDGEYRGMQVGGRVDKLFLPRKQAPTLDELMGADRLSIGGEGPLYYTAAWKLIHVLRGHANPAYEPRLSAMMADLMAGTDGRTAFARACKGVLLSEIEREYQAMSLDAREYPRRLPFQAPSGVRASSSRGDSPRAPVRFPFSTPEPRCP